MLFAPKELRKKIKEYSKQLKYEAKQKLRLMKEPFDYSYLEQLIKRAENNPDLIIEITTSDKSTILIKTDRKAARLRSQVLFEQLEESL